MLLLYSNCRKLLYKCLYFYIKLLKSKMDVIRNGWFSEIQDDLWPGQCFSLKVKQIIHEEKSQYQDIKVIETETYGRCLLLDNIIQCTMRDEFSYQEMISFLPLCCHPNPKRVLIVGGGDGGVAREVTKHPLVDEIHQVEIDERVVDVSKKYLPSMACGFDSPKLTLVIGDGFDYMRNNKNKFDVIITDSSDPIGPAATLFTDTYYELIRKSLKDDGVFCSQGGNFWLDKAHIKNVLQNCKKFFTQVAYAVTSVPSYPSGCIGFFIGSVNNRNGSLSTPVVRFTSTELDRMNMKYYTSEIHSAAFTLPRWIENYFNETKTV